MHFGRIFLNFAEFFQILLNATDSLASEFFVPVEFFNTGSSKIASPDLGIWRAAKKHKPI
jgi:hypothetical protein